jgi:hypothetical protein
MIAIYSLLWCIIIIIIIIIILLLLLLLILLLLPLSKKDKPLPSCSPPGHLYPVLLVSI